MTKYTQDILSAAADITAAGTTIQYYAVARTKDTTSPWKNDTITTTTYNIAALIYTDLGVMPKTITSSTTELVSRDLGVPTTDIDILIPGNVPFVPDMNDTLEINATIYKIVKIDILQPDGTPILYTLKVRS